ncbi:MAG: hypothetical protein QNI84_07410 [Henriciella sp.]|nr:hypothetical protein [Henriciella sp.]
MTVSTRNTILTGIGALALVTVGGVASAGGGKGGGSPCATSGCGGGAQPMTPPPSNGGKGCCGNAGKGHAVVVPGVNVAGPNVTVSGPHVTVNQGSYMSHTQTFLNTNVYGGGQTELIVTGGGGYYAAPGVAPSSIGALSVTGGDEYYTETVVEKVPATEEYCAEKISYKETLRPVQAVCIDDKGVPHPASRVDAQDKVSDHYKGELFRCMAGTSMQVTLGDVTGGKVSFAHGETFACRKGEALVHKPGGNLACAPQAPQRSCNERSLLRRHGPGVKLIRARTKIKTCEPQTRTVMKSVEKQVQRVKASKPQPIVLDGGVGQGVQ